MTWEQLKKIIEKYDNCRDFVISKAFGDGGCNEEILMGRLDRAAGNQINDGAAAFSRYGIWANTVRDHIIEAERLIAEGNISDARRLLIRAANSMSAFADIQAHFDTMGIANIEK